MNQQTPDYEQQLTLTDVEWDTLRDTIKDSAMAKTNLCSLAKNLGYNWPMRGEEEIPERYISRPLDELKEMPEFYGKGSRLSLLYSILLETKQLDDPFADMIELFDEPALDEDRPPSVLEQLEVSPDYPVELMPFSKRTLTICRDGGHNTVGQLIEHLQKSESATHINEEFRQFNDHLNHVYKPGLKKYLPIREGSKGIFLAEAIGHIGRRMTSEQAATLVYAYKVLTTNPDWGDSAVMAKAKAIAFISEVKEAALKAFELMPDEAQELRCAIQSGTNASVRFFVPLNDPELEGLTIAIAMAAMDLKPRLKGLIGLL